MCVDEVLKNEREFIVKFEVEDFGLFFGSFFLNKENRIYCMYYDQNEMPK